MKKEVNFVNRVKSTVWKYRGVLIHFLFRHRLFLLSIAIIAALAVQVLPLKTLGYSYIPQVGVTFDEYAHVWVGKSVLETGIPVAWSDRSSMEYQKGQFYSGDVDGFSLKTEGKLPNIFNFFNFPKPSVAVIKFAYGIGDRYINLVQPDLDYPPLAGVIYALGLDKSVKTFTEVTADQFRRPAIWLSYLTGILAFVLMAKLYNPLVGVVAFAVYSVIPSAVFASRLALAENVLSPLLLFSLLALFWAKSHQKLFFWLVAGFTAGLAFLAKFSGVSAILAGILILFYWQASRKQFLYFLASSILPIVAYLGYTYFIGQELFVRILLAYASRAAL